MYVKKILKKDISNNKEKTNICISLFKIKSRLFEGRKPPDEIIDKARFNELKDLIFSRFKVIKINIVNPEYKKNIFKDCLIVSDLLNDKKFVKDFLKLLS